MRRISLAATFAHQFEFAFGDVFGTTHGARHWASKRSDKMPLNIEGRSARSIISPAETAMCRCQCSSSVDRKIGPHMHAAGFLPLQRRTDHQPRNRQHVLQFPTLGIGKLPRQHVAAPAVDIFGRLDQAVPRRAARRTRATSAISANCECRPDPAARRRRTPADSPAATPRTYRPLAPPPPTPPAPAVHAEHQSFQQTVRRQPIRPVQPARRHFARRPQPRHASCAPSRSTVTPPIM